MLKKMQQQTKAVNPQTTTPSWLEDGGGVDSVSICVWRGGSGGGYIVSLALCQGHMD